VRKKVSELIVKQQLPIRKSADFLRTGMSNFGRDQKAARYSRSESPLKKTGNSRGFRGKTCRGAVMPAPSELKEKDVNLSLRLKGQVVLSSSFLKRKD